MIEVAGYQQYSQENQGGQVLLGSLISSFREKIPQKKEALSQSAHPELVLQNDEDKNSLLLLADDCVRGESGKYYGHSIRVDVYPEWVRLTPNFLAEEIIVRSSQESSAVINELVDRYTDKNWKDLNFSP